MSENFSDNQAPDCGPDADFAELARLRKQVFNGAVTSLLITAAAFGLLFWLSPSGNALTIWVIVAVIVVLCAIFATVKLYGTFRTFFKTHIVAEVISKIHPELRYTPERGLDCEVLASTELFKSRIDRYHSEDLIEGKIGDTAVRFSEVHAERKEVHHNGKRTTVQYVKVFRGVLLEADFNKDFSGRTVVLPDVAERFLGKLIGNFLQNYNFTREQLVKLEDPEFERLFAVYGTDQQQSRYILTPSMMERLVALRKRVKHNIYLAFKNSRMYLAIMTNENRFEPRMFGSSSPEAIRRRVAAELTGITSIIDELALNTRIWSKGGSFNPKEN